MIWWADGSGWSGKQAAWLICNEFGHVESKKYTEPKTNNEMEYEAVINALEQCKKGDEIRTDSQLVVSQVKGAWKCKDIKLFPLMLKAQALYKAKQATITWIPRKESMAGNLIEGLK
jgi:ribonuclease HI